MILIGKKPETVFNLEDLHKILLVELSENSLKDTVFKGCNENWGSSFTGLQGSIRNQ